LYEEVADYLSLFLSPAGVRITKPLQSKMIGGETPKPTLIDS